MKTTTAKKPVPARRTRRASPEPSPRRKVKMPDFMKNLKEACGDRTFDHLFARVEAGH